jgi:hypothetical protein
VLAVALVVAPEADSAPPAGAEALAEETEERSGAGAIGTAAVVLPAGAPEVCELAPGAAGVPGVAVAEHTQLDTVTVDTMVTGEAAAEAAAEAAGAPGEMAPPGPVTLEAGAGGTPTTGALPVLTQESAFK